MLPTAVNSICMYVCMYSGKDQERLGTTRSALIDCNHFTSVAKIVSRGITAVSEYWVKQNKKTKSVNQSTWNERWVNLKGYSFKSMTLKHFLGLHHTFSKEAIRSTVKASHWTAPQSSSSCHCICRAKGHTS
jgi:hypothetical protein